MARKRQGTDWGTLAVMAIIVAAPILLAILLFLLRASALLLLFALPLLVLLGYFFGGPSVIPVPPKPASEKDNIEELNLKKAKASKDLSYEDRIDQGHDEGFTLTSASAGTRFDRRSPRARQLNGQLDKLHNERTDLEIKIVQFSVSRRDAIDQFKNELTTWSLKASLRRSANVAFGATVCASIVLLAARQAQVPILPFVDDLLTRLNFPLNLILPFKAAAMGYLAAMITYPVSKAVLQKRVWLAAKHYQQSQPTNELPLDFEPTITAFAGDPKEDFEDVRDEDEEFEKYIVEEQPIENEKWYQVLKVDPDATIKEIKSAYHLQLKQNHPDNVATLGITIIEAAEKQTKRINAAYEEARAQKQF